MDYRSLGKRPIEGSEYAESPSKKQSACDGHHLWLRPLPDLELRLGPPPAQRETHGFLAQFGRTPDQIAERQEVQPQEQESLILRQQSEVYQASSSRQPFGWQGQEAFHLAQTHQEIGHSSQQEVIDEQMPLEIPSDSDSESNHARPLFIREADHERIDHQAGSRNQGEARSLHQAIPSRYENLEQSAELREITLANLVAAQKEVLHEYPDTLQISNFSKEYQQLLEKYRADKTDEIRITLQEWRNLPENRRNISHKRKRKFATILLNETHGQAGPSDHLRSRDQVEQGQTTLTEQLKQPCYEIDKQSQVLEGQYQAGSSNLGMHGFPISLDQIPWHQITQAQRNARPERTGDEASHRQTQGDSASLASRPDRSLGVLQIFAQAIKNQGHRERLPEDLLQEIRSKPFNYSEYKKIHKIYKIQGFKGSELDNLRRKIYNMSEMGKEAVRKYLERPKGQAKKKEKAVKQK